MKKTPNQSVGFLKAGASLSHPSKPSKPSKLSKLSKPSKPSNKFAEKKATRDAYGQTLLALGKQKKDIVVLDADLSGSTKTNLFAKEFPERFFNVGVAEQNLVGMAAGFALSGSVPFASSFAMFLSGRAWEIVRNSVAYPNLNVKLVATHAGLTVGEDGASHQCLEDIATMRVLPGMHVFVPADYLETEAIIKRVYEIKGPCYVRCGRPSIPILSHPSPYSFKEGKGQVRREGKDVLLIACGVMVHIVEQAAELLAAKGIEASVINMASIKPIDDKLILNYAKKTGTVISVEEHNIMGGLGSAVSEVLSAGYPVPLLRMGVPDKWGQSGPAMDLLTHYGLHKRAIVQAAKKVIQLK